MIPFLTQNENVDVRRLTEEVVTNLGLPQSILLPQDEALAATEAEAALEQQRALGGAVVAEPGAGEIPPELAALLEAEAATPDESFAAGGGSPVRGEA